MVILLVINAVLLALLLIAVLLYVSYRRDRTAAAELRESSNAPILAEGNNGNPPWQGAVTGALPSQVLDLRSNPPRIYTVPTQAPDPSHTVPPQAAPASADPIDAASATRPTPPPETGAATSDAAPASTPSPSAGKIAEAYDDGGNTLTVTIDLVGAAPRKGVTNLIARLITMGLRPIESEDDGAVLAAADGRMVRISVVPLAADAGGGQASRYRIDTLAYPNGMAVFHIVHSLFDTGFTAQWHQGDEVLLGNETGAVARARVHRPSDESASPHVETSGRATTAQETGASGG